METLWFGIPDATRKVTELSDRYQKSSVSYVKTVLKYTCWTNVFYYSIGSTSLRRGFSDNSGLILYSKEAE